MRHFSGMFVCYCPWNLKVFIEKMKSGDYWRKEWRHESTEDRLRFSAGLLGPGPPSACEWMEWSLDWSQSGLNQPWQLIFLLFPTEQDARTPERQDAGTTTAETLRLSCLRQPKSEQIFDLQIWRSSRWTEMSPLSLWLVIFTLISFFGFFVRWLTEDGRKNWWILVQRFH